MIRLTAAAVAALLAMPASAQESPPRCMPAEQALRAALELYQERAIITGTIANGTMMVVVTAADNGSWTLWAQPRPGVFCVVMSGEDWGEAPPSMAVEPGDGT